MNNPVLSLLDSIKGPKNLSFKYWRYRLLHWTFGVHATCPAESKLPKFLYTHFCPLFHLTNFLLIVSPITLIGKIIYTIIEPIGNLLNKWMENAALRSVHKAYLSVEKQKEADEYEKNGPPILENPTEDETKHRRFWEQQKVKKIIRAHWEELGDFNYFMARFSRFFIILPREEVEVIFNDQVKQLEEVEAEEARRKAKLHAWIVFFVNFSQIFIKSFMTAFYLALAVAVALFLFYFAVPIAVFVLKGCLELAMWFFNTDLWAVLSFVLKIVAMVAGMWLIIYGMSKLPIWGKITSFFSILEDGLIAGCQAIAKVCNTITNFISMFYEESCPPITIVDEET